MMSSNWGKQMLPDNEMQLGTPGSASDIYTQPSVPSRAGSVASASSVPTQVDAVALKNLNAAHTKCNEAIATCKKIARELRQVRWRWWKLHTQ